MAMSKTGFADAKVGTASFKVGLGADGNIAIGSTPTAGSKRISFNTVLAEATKTGAEAVANVFLKTLPGNEFAADYDNLETTFSVKWEVA